MSLLVKELRIVYEREYIDEYTIIRFLIKLLLLNPVILIHDHMYSIKQCLHKVMLAYGIPWLGVLHQ